MDKLESVITGKVQTVKMPHAYYNFIGSFS